ncbi:multicatalytic endopeptidase [Mycoemilia scoparia]|uniref:Multicatalytic endopeptidase n=1 Tax=Mycoemilia scoparia TaxID=417184 RepID=A0A9W7ZVC3_9FUNG|nr:multicatalytic endopeptidase [Mycoemilia scoparia]
MNFRGGMLDNPMFSRGLGGPQTLRDTSETIHISSLALLKMLKHGRAGVPMEVMGLMLGEFVDDYTIQVVDVYAMPQSGTSVSVESIDEVYQTQMKDLLKQTGRHQDVVGWYHSHPGFGCWLSSTDTNTQAAFEQLDPRSVAVVIDPIQSVKGKVVIDAFRLITPTMSLNNKEPRENTSNVGLLNKPNIQALVHGLNRQYYSLVIDYRKNRLEEKMLLNLNKKNWSYGMRVGNFKHSCGNNQESIKRMLELTEKYSKSVAEESTLNAQQLQIRHVGKQDPKRHLAELSDATISNSIVQNLATALDEKAFRQNEDGEKSSENNAEAMDVI